MTPPEPVRQSKPYVEFVRGSTDAWPGDQVERDDGWGRVVRVQTWGFVPWVDGEAYQSEIEWAPCEEPS